jgi:Ras-related GTP-binding protein A/B
MLVHVEYTHVRFLGNLVLNLWDCGGQNKYFDHTVQQEETFKHVEVLIYVFDIESSNLQDDIAQFDIVLEQLEKQSPEASIFILIHKMDLVSDDRDRIFKQRSDIIAARSS